MKARPLLIILLVVPVAALAWAQASLALTINGRSVPGKTLSVNGQTYVPLSALKAAGATTTTKAGRLYVTLAPAGGANQVAAVEGKIGEWLFNGIWRFRVISLTKNDDRPGWMLHVELRNGSKLDNVALGGTGFQSIKLVMADGNALLPYNVTDIDRPIGQGGIVETDMLYYDDEGRGRKPVKLIVTIKPDASTVSFLKNQGASYSVKDPSFRIRLIP